MSIEQSYPTSIETPEEHRSRYEGEKAERLAKLAEAFESSSIEKLEKLLENILVQKTKTEEELGKIDHDLEEHPDDLSLRVEFEDALIQIKHLDTIAQMIEDAVAKKDAA